MHPLHLTKVAVGCATADALRDRMAARAGADGAAWIETRYRPTRHLELVGGSLYWIIKHRLIARQPILGFEEAEGGRWRIRLDAVVVAVRARPRRAHQGWRYLAAADVPADFDDGEGDIAALPPGLAADLAALGLI